MEEDEADVRDEGEQDPNAPNPFAIIDETDESYYSGDPKKALRIYFEREGEECEYETEELGVAKFKCRIRLPINNKFGESVYAEVTHDGKKKECIAACALEACKCWLGCYYVGRRVVESVG